MQYARRLALPAGLALLLWSGYVWFQHFILQTPTDGRPLVCAPSPHTGFAYVTYLATADYMPGVPTLINSILRSGTPHPSDYGEGAFGGYAKEQVAARAAQCGWNTSRVSVSAVTHMDGPNGRLKHARFAHNWTRLRMFQLPFRKVIFIDADAIVVENVDNLFLLPGQIAGVRAVDDSLRDINSFRCDNFCALHTSEALFNTLKNGLRAARAEQREFFYRLRGRNIECTSIQHTRTMIEQHCAYLLDLNERLSVAENAL